MKKKFMSLFQHSSDCVQAQDALSEFYEETAIISGGYAISDEEAHSYFESILSDVRLSACEKDAYLDALDVTVQNHHALGMAAGIINEIHAAQGWLILNGGV